jgi:hypothetical protein
MTRADYEQQKRLLEEQHRAAVQLLEAGYQARLRELEAAWGQDAASGAAAPAAVEALAPLPARQRARPPGDLLEEIVDAWDRLPERLTKADILGVIGWTPERSSLHRAVDVLLWEGWLAIEVRGSGRQPNIYRKQTPPAAEET